MLINNRLQSVFGLKSILTNRLAQCYIKQKQIDQISNKYGTTTMEKIKKYTLIFQHIIKEGFKNVKNDINLMRQLKYKEQLNKQQLRTAARISHDMSKMVPLIIIQILPFSGPLFMLYMYTYPGSIPSWFMIDYYHDRHEELKVRNQQKTIKYYQETCFKAQQIDINQMTLPQLRKISLLLFGVYRDGTVGYRKLFNKKIEYLFFDAFSKMLIKRYMDKRFRMDFATKEHTEHMQSLQEKVKWKFQQVMKGQFRFEYVSMYEHTLQKMATDQGKQSQIYNENNTSSTAQLKPSNENNTQNKK